MRRTIAGVLLLTATVFWAGCTTSYNSNTAGNANVTATPANANTGAANTNKANANMHGNMNMSNMNMGKANKKPNANKTP